MFSAPRDSSPRQRSASRSTDDHSSTKDGPRRLFQRYVRDLSMSPQSLVSTSSYHDDLHTPSLPTHAPHTTSAQSTPMTSPSTGHSSLFPGSLSSATSESVPSPESKYQTEFGLLTPGSSPYSPKHRSASSRSSHPVPTRSRSTTESDPQVSAPRIPHRYPSGHSSNRPSTAPHSPPVSQTSSSADTSPVDYHTRSHSRLTVSIKNLLKPVVPSPSRFSFNSTATTPSDSEASSRSFHVLATPSKWPVTPRKSRPPDLEISGSVAPAMHSPGRTYNTQIDAHRRYASEVAPKICTGSARTGSGPAMSHESLDISARNMPLTPARGRTKTRNVLRRRPSGSAKLFKGRERGMSSCSHPHEGDADGLRLPPKDGMSRQGRVPFPLTAAGAVVEAYKQQELHCDDTLNPPKPSIDDRMNSIGSHDGRPDRDHLEHSLAPYYTVLGSSSEHHTQAGGPGDRWRMSEAEQYVYSMSQATSLHQPSMSDPGSRSITRKVSTRWRKITGGGLMSEESPSRARGHSKGRPSLQEIWGGDKSGTRSTEQSMDGGPNAGDGAWACPIVGHPRSGSEKGDGSEGGKLWRLMRRISTGGLRDRFQSDNLVPPVPAIPKELLEKVNPAERSNEALSTSRHQPSSSSRDINHTRTSTASKNIAFARPSVATTASSPNSSDVASIQFFHKPRSARSSLSSYGEAAAVSRIPGIVVDRHIITPLEQLRLGDDHVDSKDPGTSWVPVPRPPRRSTSVPAGLRTVEDGEDDRVPLPSPRRQTCSGESPSSGSRPSSTSLSASGSARTSYQGRGLGPERSRMEDGIVSLSPPPRSPKNLRRGGGESMAGSPPHSMVVKQVGRLCRIGGVRQVDRVPSAQSDMTARLESPEPRRSRGKGHGGDRDRDTSPHTSAQPTFRELDGPRRPPLSEREKANIWNDLLARSDQAGGTLHINGAAELMSDSMRFSTHSEI
ncbi:hypothetical protein J3R83DRAFT_7972 [Lanmaoa asiatica]|nr:hypothetical protein J3R83DRAFT_7972 [Lanmaoa asiatica]